MEEKRRAAREVIDILQDISKLLVNPYPSLQGSSSSAHAMQNTGLDRNALSICVSLIENGVNPEALAVRCLSGTTCF